METIRGALEKICQEELRKAVLSSPRGDSCVYRKITVEQKEYGYQAEKLTEKQAFHENLTAGQVPDFLADHMEKGFSQLNAWSGACTYSLRISKKGKLLFQQKKIQRQDPVRITAGHNRRKKYLLEEGTVIPPLVDMGIFTQEGKVVRTMYDKFRQINKFVEFIDDALEKSGLKKVHMIDFGCGKSYLTFVVYYYLVYIKKIETEIIGLDLKADVIEKCNRAAEKYGYHHLKFCVGDINGFESPMPVDMVISLHACDTATDHALFNAVRWNARIIISVPCCQHELCSQMESSQLPLFQRYGIIKERTAALMTDAIRGNLLEYCGYKTQLLEFVDLAHTPKNILIRAVKSNITKQHRARMLEEVRGLCSCFHFEPTLLRLLETYLEAPGNREGAVREEREEGQWEQAGKNGETDGAYSEG